MNTIDVDLNTIPDEVLSALSLPTDLGTQQSYALDPQHALPQQQQHHPFAVQHQQAPLHHPQFGHHPPSQQQHQHPQYAAQPQQHHAQPQQQQQQQLRPPQAHLQQHQQQQQHSMHQATSQRHHPQQYQDQFYSQNFSTSAQPFPSPSSYHYPPFPSHSPSYQSSIMKSILSPSHSVISSSVDIPPAQNSSLQSMASHNHPPYSSNPPAHQVPPSSQMSSPPNPNFMMHQLNRSLSDAGGEPSFLNLDQVSSQGVRHLQNHPTDKAAQQRYNTNAWMSQNPNSIPQSPSANTRTFDNVSPGQHRAVMNRSNNLNNQQVSTNQPRPYQGGNPLPSSMPQPNYYPTDALGRPVVSSNNSSKAAIIMPQQSRVVPSHSAKDGSNNRMASLYTTALNGETNTTRHNASNGSPSMVTTSSTLGPYQPRYPSASQQNINQQSMMAVPPGIAPPIRAAPPRGGMSARGAVRGSPSVRGSPAVRGSPSVRARGPTPSRGAARGGQAPPLIRGPPPPIGQPLMRQGAPPPPGAVPTSRGVPASTRGVSTRGQPATQRGSASAAVRGGPSGNSNVPPVRGGASGGGRGPAPARGAAVSRGGSTRSRGGGGGGAGRGRGLQRSNMVDPYGFHRTPSQPEAPEGNPIQWYRMPEAAAAAATTRLPDTRAAPGASSGFHSDIEAMRASSTTCEAAKSTVGNNIMQNQRPRVAGEQSRPPQQTSINVSSQGNGRDENRTGGSVPTAASESSTSNNKRPMPGQSMAIRLKQEIVEKTPLSSSSAKTIESRVRPAVESNNNISRDIQPNRIESTIPQTVSNPKQSAENTNINQITLNQNVQSRQPKNTTEDPCVESDHNSQVDRKPFGSARDRIYSLWRDGQVVGRSAKVKARNKPTPSSSSGAQMQALDENDKRKNVSGDNARNHLEMSKNPVAENENENESPVSSSDSRSIQAKIDKKNLFYVLFHGHKLICLSSGNSNAVLICQFQYECFADKGKGMVSNCINKAFRIKKKVLDHPNRDNIVNFLRNNGYLKGVLQHEPVYMISLDDARRVYHFMYNIKNCSTATCVVEVLNQSVDLNIVISPSKRKILTQEMKMRIKREKKQADDERYGKSLPVPKSASQLLAERKASSARHKSSSSGPSDQTLAYGTGECSDDDEDSDDVVIVEGPEDPYLLKWDGKQSKPGCVCNTIVGQVRSYHHEGENYLVVSDLCRILGTSEFMTGIETDNVILYSCTKDILSFLNELNKSFPQLDTGQNCLVREKDVGVHATGDDSGGGQGDPSQHSEMNTIAPLKRPLCKQELVEDDVEESGSDPKKPRLSGDQAESKKTAPTPSSNVIIEFDARSINVNGDKSLSQTVSNGRGKDPKSSTGLSSPDSCLSAISQDGPQSPSVLHQQKDPNSSAQACETYLSSGVSSQLIASSQTSVIGDENSSEKSGSEHTDASKPNTSTTASEATTDDHLSSESSTTAMSTTKEAAQKRVVATVIDISSVTNVTNKAANNSSKPCDDGPSNGTTAPCATARRHSLPTIADAASSKSKNRPSDQDLLSKLTCSKGLPVSKRKQVEDDLELSKLHVTSLEGLEEYRSRGSLLREMEVLRFKNKTLQETLKVLRDQLKKSKAEHEKSQKLATYYGTVIQEITATFKDGDKKESPEPNCKSSGMSTSPICIDDDDD